MYLFHISKNPEFVTKDRSAANYSQSEYWTYFGQFADIAFDTAKTAALNLITRISIDPPKFVNDNVLAVTISMESKRQYFEQIFNSMKTYFSVTTLDNFIMCHPEHIDDCSITNAVFFEETQGVEFGYTLDTFMRFCAPGTYYINLHPVGFRRLLS